MTADTKLYTSGAVSDRVSLERWRLLYLIERGTLPPPSFQVPGRRLFTEDDIRRIEAVLATRPELARHADALHPDSAS
jgi:DNA-binding transcriptional MerR regulator